MKYDFLKDIDRQYSLDCAPLYKELFKGIKFVPKTLSFKKESTKEYFCVDVKDPNVKNNIIKLYIDVIYNEYTKSYHIHDFFFKYNTEYFAVYDIRMEEAGLSYKYECYGEAAVQYACVHKNTWLPMPDDFKELKLPSISSGDENIPDYFTRNIISHITEKHYMESVIKDVMPRARVRTSDV